LITSVSYVAATKYSRLGFALASAFVGYSLGYSCGYLQAVTQLGLSGKEAEFYAQREGLLVASIDFAAGLTIARGAGSLLGASVFLAGAFALSYAVNSVAVQSAQGPEQVSAGAGSDAIADIGQSAQQFIALSCTAVSAVTGFGVNAALNAIRSRAIARLLPSSLLKNGKIDFNDISDWALNKSLANEWNPSSNFPSGGFKHKWTDGVYDYSVHGHGINPNAVANHPGSNSATGPTASIYRTPVGGGPTEVLTTNGTWGTFASDPNAAHIPLTGSPY
jgi:hypothetical protein